MRFADLNAKRVAVWGFGREGRAATLACGRFLPQQSITVLCAEAERADAESLAMPRVIIETTPVDAPRLSAFDVIIKSPGITPHQSIVHEARAHGVQFTSGSALWFAEHRSARTICVTATKGKSTTTSLIAHLLRSLGVRTALAGNIGLPLLELPEGAPGADVHVIELSSFQTLDANARPTLAVIGNVLEEHLDWHGSVAQYRADKLALLDGALACLLNDSDAVLKSLPLRPGTHWYGTEAGWHVTGDFIARGAEMILPVAKLPLPGRHNAENACAALAAIDLLGFDAVAAALFLPTFRPLPHRLQTLGTRAGIRYVNDSIATTPAAALAALTWAKQEAEVVVHLVGGHDRKLDWQSFIDTVLTAPPTAVVFTGASGRRVFESLDDAATARLNATWKGDFDAAFREAQGLLANASMSRMLLLSPGAPSFGQFRDYVERGRRFAELAGFDPESISGIAGLGVS